MSLKVIVAVFECRNIEEDVGGVTISVGVLGCCRSLYEAVGLLYLGSSRNMKGL
jgi:hypothetical protein